MIFRQLFEPESSTYTYLIACPDSREAVLVDPVIDTVERDMGILADMGLTLHATVETHVHADHLTGAARLRALSGCKVAYPAMLGLPCADIGVQEGAALSVGSVTIMPLFTPGHTDHHHAYLIEASTQARVFTGDALLIDGCGRTDFQSGDSAALYHSVRDKLFSLAGETLVYPGHDYKGRRVSSIAQEKARNPRLGGNTSEKEFIALMDNLDLPYPRKIDFAVPGNETCGLCPDNIPEEFAAPCPRDDQG